MRRDDGRWVIGYGHTLSAREGGVVSEGDAELLLQYDLLPVAAALNGVPASLNQHQFDALASFVHSIGLDRFQGSDVLSRLTAGAQSEAADAIIGWADPSPADAGMRRRAAERALFVADPGRPVALAELLSAPLPPPPVSVPEINVPMSDTQNGTDAVPAVEDLIPTPASPEPEIEIEAAEAAQIKLPASDDLADSAAVLETPDAIDTDEVPADPTPVLDAGEGPPDDVTDDASSLDTDAVAADLPEPHHPSVFDPTAQASDDFLAGADTETQVSPTGFGTELAGQRETREIANGEEPFVCKNRHAFVLPLRVGDLAEQVLAFAHLSAIDLHEARQVRRLGPEAGGLRNARILC